MSGLALATLANVVAAEHPVDNGEDGSLLRFDRSKFHIGGYYLMRYALDEEHVRDVRDCGIDFVYGFEATTPQLRSVLELFEKYELAAFVGCWPVPKNGSYRETCTPDLLRAAVDRLDESGLRGFRSLQGGFVGDEPSAREFPAIGWVVRQERELLPEALPYLNLFPSYATSGENTAEVAKSQLGCKDYQEYVDLYCKHVPLDYLSCDFYPYARADESLLPELYANYQIVADACRGTGRDFWLIAQVNSRRQEEWTSENRLRFQAFVAMSYGCVCINWACYCAGWWHNQVLDKEGMKTEQYAKLKRVNGEIREFASKYMRFRNVATEYVGYDSDPGLLRLVKEKKTVKSVTYGPFKTLRAEDGLPLLVGEMTPRKGDSTVRALFICATDDPFDKNHRIRSVRFCTAAKKLRAFGVNGKLELKRISPGTWSFPIESSSAVLLVAN